MKANSLSKIHTRGNDLLEKIIKENHINKGMMGTIYLAIDPATGSQYAYKIEKMLPRDVPRNFKSPYWREIEFDVHNSLICSAYVVIFARCVFW